MNTPNQSITLTEGQLYNIAVNFDGSAASIYDLYGGVINGGARYPMAVAPTANGYTATIPALTASNYGHPTYALYAREKATGLEHTLLRGCLHLCPRLGAPNTAAITSAESLALTANLSAESIALSFVLPQGPKGDPGEGGNGNPIAILVAVDGYTDDLISTGLVEFLTDYWCQVNGNDGQPLPITALTNNHNIRTEGYEKDKACPACIIHHPFTREEKEDLLLKLRNNAASSTLIYAYDLYS